MRTLRRVVRKWFQCGLQASHMRLLAVLSVLERTRRGLL